MSAQAKAQDTDVNANPLVLDWLAQSPVFAGLGRYALQEFVEGSVLRNFEPLEAAISEGERQAALNIVVSGRLIILLASNQLTRFADNAMVSLDCYLAGDSFGEGSLIQKTPLPATASIVATESSQVLSISRNGFGRAVGTDSRIGMVVYRNLFEIQSRRLNVLGG